MSNKQDIKYRDFDELKEKFIPFRETLLKQIHQFEQENDCHIVAMRNLEFVVYTSVEEK